MTNQTKVINCSHYWIFDDPTDKTSKGKCKLCGAETVGDNCKEINSIINPLAFKYKYMRRYHTSVEDLENPMWDNAVKIVERG